MKTFLQTTDFGYKSIHSRIQRFYKTLCILPILILSAANIQAQSIVAPDSVYAGEPIGFSLTNAIYTQYQWDFGDGNSGTSNFAMHTYTPTTCGYHTMNVSVVVTDSNSNSFTYSKSIVVKNKPPKPILIDLDLMTPFSNCDNNPSLSNPNFTINLANGTPDSLFVDYYIINWGDFSSADTIKNHQFPISHTYTNLGLFQCSITAISDYQCPSSTTYLIANQSNPAVGLSSLGSTQGCAPQEFTFILSQYQNNSPGTYYIWNFGDGSPTITWNYNDPFVNDSIKHIFQNTSCANGGLAFTVSVTAYSYCDQTTATVSNIRIYTKPQASFTKSSDTTCVGSNITLNNNTLSGFGYNCNGNANYIWSFGDGTTSNQKNAMHSYSAAGTYTIKLIATNGVCGTSADSTRIIVNESPKAVASILKQGICDTVKVYPTNQSTGGNLKYLWTVSKASGWNFKNGTATSANPSFVFYSKGVYNLKLTTYNNCGTDDTTFIIVVRTTPSVAISTIPDFCGSATINPTAAIDSNYSMISFVNWSLSGSNIGSTPNINPSNVQYSASGTYNVILTVGNQCGLRHDTLQFVVHALPPVKAMTTKNNICQNDSTLMIATGAQSYQWLQNGNIISSNQSLSVSPLNTVKYYVVGTDIHQCTNTDSITVQVYSLPNVVIGNSNTNICLGDTINLNASGANIYQWSNGINIVGTSPNLNTNPSKSGYYKIEGIDNNGCVNSDSVLINVFTKPILGISPSSASICKGDSVQIQLTGASNILINNILSSNNSFYAKPLSTSNFHISGYDLPGCQTDSNIVVKVIDLPKVAISQNKTAICFGDSIIFSGSGASTYHWFNNTNPAISNSQYVIYKPTMSGQIILEGVDTTGCSNKDTTYFTVNQLPNIQIQQGSYAVCQGDSFQLNASGGLFYQWKQNNSFLSTASVIKGTLTQSSVFNLTGIDINGCSKAINVSLTALPLPIIQPTLSKSALCYGDSSLLNLNGGVTYWINGNQAGSQSYLKPNQNTTYQIVGSDINNCRDTSTIQLTINPTPTVLATANNTSLCLGQSVQLTGSGANTYIWTSNQGYNGLNSPTITTSPLSTTTYYLTGIDTNGCYDFDSIKVNVSTVVQLQTTSSKTSICKGDTVSLMVSGAQFYQWSSGNGLLSQQGSTVNAIPLYSSTYLVTGTDTMGCIANSSVSVTVNNLPLVNIITSKNSICPSDSVLISAQGAQNYQWIITDTAGSVAVSSSPSNWLNPLSNTIINLIGTDSNLCTNTQSSIITVNPNPNIQLASNDDTICIGQPIILTASGGTTYQWKNGISQQNIANVSLSPATSQTYYVDGINNHGCIGSDSIFIKVNPLPTISSANSNPAICSGDSAILSVNGSGVVIWQPTIGIGSITGHTTKASPLSSTTYTATLTDSNGCQNSKSIFVTVNALPVANFGSDTLICQNTPNLFTNQSTNTTSFNWNFGDLNTSNQQSPLHAYAQTGFYQVSLIAVSSANCLDTIQKVVHVIDAPIANFTVNPHSGCSPLALNFNNLSTSYAGNYFWSTSNGLTSTSITPQNFILNGQQGIDTNIIIQLTTANKCGSSIFTDTVLLKTKPVTNFGFNLTTQCSPTTAIFGNISSNNATSFVWDMGDTTYFNGAIPSAHNYTTGSTPTDFNIRLVSINSCGTDTMTKILHLNPNYVQSIFTPSHIQACAPATISFTNYSNVQTMANWNFGDGNVSAQISPTHTYPVAGSYQVSLVVTDNCGIDTAITTIVVGNSPTIAFTMSQDTICQYSSVTFNNLTPNLCNLNWQLGDSLTSSLDSFNHQYNLNGALTVTLIGEDLVSHCTDTAQQILQVNPGANAEIVVNDPDGCYPFEVSFINQTTGGTYYTWDFDDGNTSTQENPKHNFTNPGTYNVRLVADNYFGCVDTTWIPIKAYPNPIAAFTTQILNPCTYPAQLAFNNQTTGAMGYQWDFDNLDSSYIKNPVITYQNPGSYNPRLIAYNSYNCTDTAEMNISLLPVPIADFSTDLTEGCEGIAIQFKNKSANATIFNWDFKNGDSSYFNEPLSIYNSAGIYFPVLVVGNTSGCYDTLISKDTIRIFPNPQPDFLWQDLDLDQIDEKGKFQFYNNSLFSDTYIWNFGDNTSSSDINPEHQYEDDGEFSVILMAQNHYGCSAELVKKLTVNMLKGLYIPTALAPNHPNPEVRVFKPVGKGLATLHLAVYDSWGKLLWETTELQDGEPVQIWNGNDLNGNPLPQGTYFWFADAIFEDGTIWKGMELPDGRIIDKGSVVIIR